MLPPAKATAHRWIRESSCCPKQCQADTQADFFCSVLGCVKWPYLKAEPVASSRLLKQGWWSRALNPSLTTHRQESDGGTDRIYRGKQRHPNEAHMVEDIESKGEWSASDLFNVYKKEIHSKTCRESKKKKEIDNHSESDLSRGMSVVCSWLLSNDS